MINPEILKCSDPKCDEPSLPNSFKCELHEKRPTILKSFEDLKKAIDKKNVVQFYFKVNNSKLDNKNKLKSQIEMITKRLIERKNIKSKTFDITFGTVDDDFILGKSRMLISFK